jgi:cell division protein FtsB
MSSAGKLPRPQPLAASTAAVAAELARLEAAEAALAEELSQLKDDLNSAM